jgi:hypothetical protein
MTKGYMGNPFLKRIREQVGFDAHNIQEYIKCMNDPVYFTKTYMKIVHVDRGLIPFELYDYQEEMLTAMKNENFCAFCIARQGGKSTAVVAFILWYILFTPKSKPRTVGLLANKGDTAREILGKLQLAYTHLPRWMTQGIIEWNKGSILLENGSRVIAAATSDANVRGYTFNMIYLDEVAHVENYEEFSTSVMPTISSGKTTKQVMTSTPYGLNHFYKTIEYGKKPKDSPEYNGCYVVEVPWNRVPGRDEEWKKKVLEKMDHNYDKFEQEYNIQFMGSSGTLIAGWKLKELVIHEPIASNKDGMRQYDRPLDAHKYVIVCDTSEGKGLDYSAFQVIDITAMPYHEVCTFRSNLITPLDFTSIIHSTAILYNHAYVLPEVTTLGEQVGNGLLFDFEYDNLLMTVNQGRFGKKLVAGFGTPKVDKGVRTTKLVKAVGCSMLKLLIEGNQLIVHDHATIEELSRFSKKGSSYEAEPGATDDLTMCLVLFAWMTNQVLFKELSNIHTLIKLRELDEETIMKNMTPMGWVTTGELGEEEEIPRDKDVWTTVDSPWVNQF